MNKSKCWILQQGGGKFGYVYKLEGKRLESGLSLNFVSYMGRNPECSFC